ncbi:MAG: pkaF [Subtercola sp.]|nr:pkaF [Subtercola sp.]
MIDRLVDGRYQVTSRIARGGMATVYVANDLRLDRRVAIKIMHGHLADDEAFRERFVQEARSAARLAHPNVVSVFDQGQDHEMAYMVMEYLPGMTLRDLLKDYGRLTTEQTLDIMEAVLGGLAAAHKAGIVHRDVKPENVLLADDGRIKIGDFGLARAASANTATGQALLGTIAYLSPELLTRGVADARSDIYATGIMMYEMLVGEQPYQGEQPMQIAFQHANDTVPAPSAKNPSVPPEVDAIVVWATSRDPNERPHDAKVMLDELMEAETTATASIAATAAMLRTSVMPPAGAAGRPGGFAGDAGAVGAGAAAGAAHASEYDDGYDTTIVNGETEVLRPSKGRGFGRGRGRKAAGAAALGGAAVGRAAVGGAVAGSGAGAAGADSAAGAAVAGSAVAGAGVAGAGVGSVAGGAIRAGAGAADARAAGSAAGTWGAPASAGVPAANRGAPGTPPSNGWPSAKTNSASREAPPAQYSGARQHTAAATDITTAFGAATLAPPAVSRPANRVNTLAARATRRRKRGWWIFALVLVLVAAGGGAGWYFSSGPGGQVTVPNVAVGGSPADAAAALTALGLTTTDASANSPTVPVGAVIGTDPAGGSPVPNGSSVSIISSLGPAQLPVPPLAGQTEAAATQAATDAHFTVAAPSQTQFSSSVDKGTVIAALGADGQPLGATYGDQQPVSFVVSLGAIPGVDGMSADDANAALVAVGLVSTVGSTDYSDSVASGDVISHEVPADPVHTGATITLHVSKGPEPVVVPDVTSKTWAAASATLEGLGFKLLYNTNADTLPDFFIVSSTDPAAGTSLPKGSSIKVSFSGF